MQHSRRFTLDGEDRALNSVGWVQQSRIFTTDREDLDLRGTVLVLGVGQRVFASVSSFLDVGSHQEGFFFPTLREYKNEPRKAQTSIGCVSLFLFIA